MQRRRFLLGATAAIVLSSRAIARAAGALRHIGVLSPGPKLPAGNLRAADALGVSVPQALQLRADEVLR